MTARVMLQRPIYGGVFGHGQYALATMPTISNGLHAVRFMVIDPRGGAVLSVAEDKRDAIASARKLLRGDAPEVAANDSQWRQVLLWPDLVIDVSLAAKPRKVSRRRHAVFAKCEGRCFYCRCALALDTFEVEHQRPRALGGADDPLNLVAACRSCNSSKGDRTALEFVASTLPTDPNTRA